MVQTAVSAAIGAGLGISYSAFKQQKTTGHIDLIQLAIDTATGAAAGALVPACFGSASSLGGARIGAIGGAGIGAFSNTATSLRQQNKADEFSVGKTSVATLKGGFAGASLGTLGGLAVGGVGGCII